ncbi:MAG: hypothetical protein VKJ27_07610 [Synechocystis sp.]|nr:hypothetical protein [Synechocystis sp.]
MSSKTDPDRQLHQFLQTYHPPTPPAAPGLEDHLFAHLPPRSDPTLGIVSPGKRRWPWLSLGLVVAAMAIGGGITWRWQTQTALTPTSPEILEAFLEDSWSGAIAVPEDARRGEFSPSQEWWQLTQSTANTSAD